MPSQPWLSQTVYVSRSVSADGEVIDGKPVPLNGFVPWTIENSNRWVESVLAAALKK